MRVEIPPSASAPAQAPAPQSAVTPPIAAANTGAGASSNGVSAHAAFEALLPRLSRHQLCELLLETAELADVQASDELTRVVFHLRELGLRARIPLPAAAAAAACTPAHRCQF